ncbi:hypothetical protein [Paenibacillus xylanexedens]|uniref:CdiA C-terminal domain-containing protein n=1 Tax=Paenibacillus xylanexedens TaxID=528191 RepID=UPI0016423D44
MKVSRLHSGCWTSSKRDPDFRIEGRIFDCYAPTENKGIRGIWSEVQEKVVIKQQTKNVVINLTKWSGDDSALLKQFKEWGNLRFKRSYRNKKGR